jgi:proteasome alpha subunit
MKSFLFVVLIVLYVIVGTHASDYASTAQFDPTGRILKTEYARRAVTERGGPVCAIRCADGILLATARRSRRNLLVLSAPPKVHFVDRHICIGVSGSLSQATALMKASRSLCARYEEIYDSPMPVEKLCDSLSDELHRLTRDGRSNPFGVALVIAGWDDELGPQVSTASRVAICNTVRYVHIAMLRR